MSTCTFEKKLIKAAKHQPVIYDIAHPLYYDAEAKEMAWQEIGEQIKHSVSSCKKKWQQLRTNLRKARMRRKKFTGDQSEFKPWKYEKDLSFLERRHKTQNKCPDYQDDDSNEIIQIFKSDDSDVGLAFPSLHIPSPCGSPSPADYSDSKESFLAAKRSSKQSFGPTEFPSLSASSNNHADEHDRMENDHIHKFFVSIEETFRRLPPESQVDAKVEMTLLLAKYEKLALKSDGTACISTSESALAPQPR
ncbi:Alcohol dehydrogenase transcription factor Myb/SANT-like [Nesidiocoris tenuis]|uniref:Alcohol dehydrogenase transcription factor Myb/SANT-like n=1 Tax=Nesidiocoris tenuis TaxID=355587 RepID=A0ABN7B0R0_9HEMI|nr:Alcohol dehydrogenase transcription factor Myb/SANT-like [Nesidiocoris tenuis]